MRLVIPGETLNRAPVMRPAPGEEAEERNETKHKTQHKGMLP